MIRAVLSEPTDFRRLYLFRHPELDASHQGRAVGAGAAPLMPETRRMGEPSKFPTQTAAVHSGV